MFDFDPEIFACFLDEALDTLNAWERSCLDLEGGAKPEIYDTLFRAAHNLKGASRAVGLDALGAFIHSVEDVIQALRRGEYPFNSLLLSLLLESQVILVQWIEGLRADPQSTISTNEFLTKLELGVEFAKQEVNGSSSNVASIKIVESNEKENKENLEVSSEVHAPQEEAPTIAAAPVEKKAPPAPSLSPSPEAPPDTKTTPPRNDETVRVAAQKLDELIQLVGELSIHQSILIQARRSNGLSSKAAQNAIMLCNKITKDLQSKALGLRMQPLNSMFQRLERVARDVARAQGKKLNVRLEGAEVELDKTVIEKMMDPLVHVLRNAVDHGIEGSEDRIATGKSEAAEVTLMAHQDAAGVSIRVIDDGRGLNAERIKQKAIEKGLIKQDAVLSVSDVNNLIFLPGFSTAEKLTDISGRGVGMDVVMRAVQSLRGTIEVQSTFGSGTTFVITLPTSLSIIEALVIKVAGSRYAVPMQELTEIIDLSSHTIESSGNREKMISLRGSIVLLEPLKRFMPLKNVLNSIPGETNDDQDVYRPALVIKEADGMVAFEIDQIIGQQQVVVRPLSENLDSLPGINSCTILADGEPGLVLDLPDIARSCLQTSL